MRNTPLSMENWRAIVHPPMRREILLEHNNQIRKSLAKEIKTRHPDISSQTIFDHLHNISHNKINLLSELKTNDII